MSSATADFLKDVDSWAEEDLMKIATVAEHAELYHDMSILAAAMIKKAYSEKPKVDEDTKQKRNLVSVAYKNIVGGQRQATRSIDEDNSSTGTKDDKGLTDEQKAELKKKYLTYIKEETVDMCNKVIRLIKENPLKKYVPWKEEGDLPQAPQAADDEDAVFWFKMVGDYCRYLAEFDNKRDSDGKAVDPVSVESLNTKDEKKKAAKWAEVFYNNAMQLATAKLPETHPTRLGLALNFSVCYYECLNEKDQATKMAKEAFDQAIEKLDTLNDDSYKDSTLIMQLLRDNLTLWTAEKQQDPNDS